MNELTIYSRIDDIRERINEKEDKKEILEEINSINEMIKELPLMKEFRNLILLYEDSYNEDIFLVTASDKE